MRTSSPVSRSTPLKGFGFGRSPIGGVSAAALSVVFASYIAIAVWGLRAERAQIAATRVVELRAVGSTLRHSAEEHLRANRLGPLQNEVAQVARQFQFSRCRIELSDGTVIADSNLTHVTVDATPNQWPGPVAGAATASSQGSVAESFTLNVEGRGTAQLVIHAPIVLGPPVLASRILIGSVVIGAIAMIVLFVFFIRSAAHLRPLGLIREALRAKQAGERRRAVLAVSNNQGPEAEAWNQLLLENEKIGVKAVSERTVESLTSHRQLRSELNRACDAMWQGLIVVDADMRAKYVNGAAAVFLQTHRDEVVGTQIGELIQHERVLEAIRAAMAGSSVQRRTFEIENQQQGGGGMLRISVRPVRHDDPDAVIIVIEDITQLRAAEDARHAFVAQATHELRTPLTNIRLYVETLLEDGDDDPKLKANAVNVINQEACRLDRIVTDMLSVAEIEAGSLRVIHDDVDLDAALHDIEADYQVPARQKGISLTLNWPPKLPVVQGDRDKIMMAIHNLVGNALKYTPSGGSVEVDVTADDAKVSIKVKDTGIGIPEADIEHVFEKFYRAKDRRGREITGSGLGLALAREVIRLHRGEIVVESKVDEGSTFTLTVPTQAQAA